MTAIENFIYQHEGEQRDILLYLHELLSEQNLLSKIRYKVPFYYGKSWICYLNPVKPDGVELAFIRGNELSNEQGLLDKKDRKMVAGITVTAIVDLPKTAVLEIIQEAILLDETVAYVPPGRRRKSE